MKERAIFAEPLNRTRLHEEIASIIEGKIIRGEVPPGAKLPSERELAIDFSVNRATVREAIRKLESYGLLDIQHGNGVFVRDFVQSGNLELLKGLISHTDGTLNKDILSNLMEARNAFCTEMAGLAALRRTEIDLNDLRNTVREASIQIKEKDLLVHQLIAKSAKNIFYVILLNFFNQTYRDLSYLYFNSEKNIKRTERFHRDILKAIENGDPAKARHVMMETLEYAEKASREYLDNKEVKVS